MRAVPIALLLAACGRIGIDPRDDAGPPPPPPVDVRVPVCPAGTVEIGPGLSTCIEIQDRAAMPWGQASSICASLERRLCQQTEWQLACMTAPAGALAGLLDGWEWMGDVVGTSALKLGGGGDCATEASSSIEASYDFRCCAPKS